MLITVGCPSCGHRYDIAGKLAGKRVRCKECASTFRVPVPVTMPISTQWPPKRKKKPLAHGIEGSISDILEVGDLKTSEPLHLSEQSGGLISDIGDRWTYRGFQLVCLAILIGFGLWGLLVPLHALIWVLVVGGVFLLVPILGGWESFERSPKARILIPLLGSEGTKAVVATIAIALWVLAVLLAMDTIHLVSLSG